jgi:hypothetical protein
MHAMTHKGSIASICTASAIALAMVSQLAWADAATTQRENQLKAAYLLNFVKFIEWPSLAAGDALNVCFLGASSVYEVLSVGLDGKRVNGRALTAREIPSGTQVSGCHVVYADANKSQELNLTSQDPRLPVLTVSDAKKFALNGGVIELFTDSNRLRFIINIDNARRSGLRIGSGLLQLATVIDKEGGK